MNNKKVNNYEQTPIYESSRELLKTIYIAVSRMNKSHKFILGSKIVDDTNELLSLLYQTFTIRKSNIEKVNYLKKVHVYLFRISANCHIANDNVLINKHQYTVIISKIIDIWDQIKRWEKSLLTKEKEPVSL